MDLPEGLERRGVARRGGDRDLLVGPVVLVHQDGLVKDDLDVLRVRVHRDGVESGQEAEVDMERGDGHPVLEFSERETSFRVRVGGVAGLQQDDLGVDGWLTGFLDKDGSGDRVVG